MQLSQTSTRERDWVSLGLSIPRLALTPTKSLLFTENDYRRRLTPFITSFTAIDDFKWHFTMRKLITKEDRYFSVRQKVEKDKK